MQTTRDLLFLLNSSNCHDVNSLGEIRKLVRIYDAEISKRLNSEAFLIDTSFNASFVITDHMFEQNAFVREICGDRFNKDALSMVVACRLALSEKVADIKYKMTPYNFLYKHNDFLKLVTDREIEKGNLRLFPHQVYLKIMDISKEIQVQYLERVVADVKIGYLFGRGTFSSEAITKFFRGTHVSYPSVSALSAALESKAVDYIFIPTYNSLIGEIIKPESYWDVLGTVDHRIELCLYSNTETVGEKDKKFSPEVLYLEPHVQKEAENYIQAHFNSRTTHTVIVDTSKTGCIQCIKDMGTRNAMTISSKNNNSNFLHLIESDIVKHNITTFSLCRM